MPQAKQGDLVTVHYTGKFDDGTVFDTSDGNEPLKFVLGKGQVIPGFERAVTGMDAGQRKTVTIPAAEAYGPHHPEMVLSVPRKNFPIGQAPTVGQRLQLQSQDGQVIVVTATVVEAESVTLDANHPLAGKDLTFDLTLVESGEDDGSCDHQCCDGDHEECEHGHDHEHEGCCGKHK
jgi:peptidylprolyl isomerase